MKTMVVRLYYSSGICRVYGQAGTLWAEVYNPKLADAFFTWVYGQAPKPENVIELKKFKKKPDGEGPKGA